MSKSWWYLSEKGGVFLTNRMRCCGVYIRHSIMSVLLVSVLGCAGLTPSFDPVELDYYATLWQYAKRLEQVCGEPGGEDALLSAIKSRTERLSIYVAYRPAEDSRQYVASISKLEDAYAAGNGKVFCEESAKNLQAGIERIMQTVAKRK